MNTPYLSLVIPTRNDEYVNNTLAIQDKCLRLLQRQLEAAAIESEILVVDYNTDPSRPRLADSLQAEAGEYVTVRVIEVEARHHQQFRFHDRRPFHQACAVNTGLRRSRGRFFVYRALDHIYSEQLIHFLARKTLHEDCIYRCDRVDIRREGFDSVQLKDWNRVSAICNLHVAFRHEPLSVEPTFRIPLLHTNACGDFLLMARALWMRIGGWEESRCPVSTDYDSLAMHAAYSICRRQEILSRECCVYKLDHPKKNVERIEQAWSPLAKRWEAFLLRKVSDATLVNLSRILFNYPRRIDRTVPGLLLDSFERHFVLPAFLWAHGLRRVRLNRGAWGLKGIALPETILARAAWDRNDSVAVGQP